MSTANYKSVRIPIFSTSIPWSEFCDLVMEQFRDSTRMANSAVLYLIRNDFSPVQIAERLAEKEKGKKVDLSYPASSTVNLYELVRKLAPLLDTQTVGTTTNRLYSEYMKKRAGFLIYMNERPPFYQFPYPIICPKGSATSPCYKFRYENERIVLSIKLGRQQEKPRWIDLILDNGSGHSYSRGAIQKVMAGELKSGAIQIELASANRADKRPTLILRDKHRNRKEFRVQVAVAVDFPVKTRAERSEKPLIVYTDKEHFLVGHSSKSVVWRLNQDHQARRMAYFSPEEISSRIESYDSRRHRLSEDAKFDSRAGRFTGVRDFGSRLAGNQNNWLSTWLHQCVSKLIDYADRRYVSVVYYNDQIQDFIPHFPWFKLKSFVQVALKDAGIEFVEIERPEDGDWDKQILSLKAKIKGRIRKESKQERERRAATLLTTQYK